MLKLLMDLRIRIQIQDCKFKLKALRMYGKHTLVKNNWQYFYYKYILWAVVVANVERAQCLTFNLLGHSFPENEVKVLN
jgi:hypothetical protein